MPKFAVKHLVTFVFYALFACCLGIPQLPVGKSTTFSLTTDFYPVFHLAVSSEPRGRQLHVQLQDGTISDEFTGEVDILVYRSYPSYPASTTSLQIAVSQNKRP